MDSAESSFDSIWLNAVEILKILGLGILGADCQDFDPAILCCSKIKAPIICEYDLLDGCPAFFTKHFSFDGNKLRVFVKLVDDLLTFYFHIFR